MAIEFLLQNLDNIINKYKKDNLFTSKGTTQVQ